MPEYISQNLTTIIVALIGIFAAGIALTIRYKRTSNNKSNNDNSNTVNQSNNRVGGDQAGRDINKR